MNVIYDIESIDPLSGFKSGELVVSYAAGRRMGKSMLKQLYYDNFSAQQSSKFMILDQAQVDGETWYTVTCIKEVSAWIRNQPKELQYSHIDKAWTEYANKFDIHEKLYTLLALRWS